MGRARCLPHGDAGRDDTEGDMGRDKAHSVLYSRRHTGSRPWARRGRANPPTFLTFVLFSSVWIPLSMILTVIWPSDTSGRRKGGLTSTVCSALGRPRYLARAEVVRGCSGGRLGLPGHRHAAPRLPGGWGAAQDPADVLTATVGEGVDAAAELARHLRDEGHGAGTGSGCGTSPVRPLPPRS